MLKELKQMLSGHYADGCVGELEKMEGELLRFPSFSSENALAVGCEIAAQSKKYGDIMICIQRRSDNAVIFQYMGNGCSQRNTDFAMMKRNTVLKTGHCSLWAMAKEQTTGGVDDVFAEDGGCLPVGGAFPIYAGRDMAATITTSGLHDGLDHKVVTEALAALRGVEAPSFSGKLI